MYCPIHPGDAVLASLQVCVLTVPRMSHLFRVCWRRERLANSPILEDGTLQRLMTVYEVMVRVNERRSHDARCSARFGLVG